MMMTLFQIFKLSKTQVQNYLAGRVKCSNKMRATGYHTFGDELLYSGSGGSLNQRFDIRARISNPIHVKPWNIDINLTLRQPWFRQIVIEVMGWGGDYFPHEIMDVISHRCPYRS